MTAKLLCNLGTLFIVVFVVMSLFDFDRELRFSMAGMGVLWPLSAEFVGGRRVTRIRPARLLRIAGLLLLLVDIELLYAKAGRVLLYSVTAVSLVCLIIAQRKSMSGREVGDRGNSTN